MRLWRSWIYSCNHTFTGGGSIFTECVGRGIHPNASRSQRHDPWFPPRIICRNPSTMNITTHTMSTRCIVLLLLGREYTGVLANKISQKHRWINLRPVLWEVHEATTAAVLTDEVVRGRPTWERTTPFIVYAQRCIIISNQSNRASQRRPQWSIILPQRKKDFYRSIHAQWCPITLSTRDRKRILFFGKGLL